MAQVSITIPDAILTRVIDGFCKRYNYSPVLDDGVTPNPETQGQFVKRKVVEYIKAAVREAEVQDASKTAAATASASVDSDIVLT